MDSAKHNITVIGGCGHVGLPLSIALADASDQLQVTIYDINEEAVGLVNRGELPFREQGASEKMMRAIGKNLKATTDPRCLLDSDIHIFVIGTPVDEHLNPLFTVFHKQLEKLLPYFRDDQTVILRSTVFPGTSEKVYHFFRKRGLNVHVAFCPERIAQGKAMTELYSLPQIISSFDEAGLHAARQVFGLLASELVELSPLEAELAKLFTNSWRYVQFATANQYYMIAESAGLDFYKIYHAITHNYPRAQGFPGAGFAAGPCLFKDTMQLSAFSGNQYFLGHSAMLINEGMPQFIVNQLKKRFVLMDKTIGILGMAFKGESDDTRSSLSYKLKKLLEFEANRVLCTDEYVEDDIIMPLEQVVEEADILILATPHRRYKTIQTDKEIVDIWNCTEKVELVPTP